LSDQLDPDSDDIDMFAKHIEYLTPGIFHHSISIDISIFWLKELIKRQYREITRQIFFSAQSIRYQVELTM